VEEVRYGRAMVFLPSTERANSATEKGILLNIPARHVRAGAVSKQKRN
jgi:hypothetical protein